MYLIKHLNSVKMQTKYTAKHNFLMSYSTVLHVLVHQNQHWALLQKYECSTLATCKFFFSESSL